MIAEAELALWTELRKGWYDVDGKKTNAEVAAFKILSCTC